MWSEYGNEDFSYFGFIEGIDFLHCPERLSRASNFVLFNSKYASFVRRNYVPLLIIVHLQVELINHQAHMFHIASMQVTLYSMFLLLWLCIPLLIFAFSFKARTIGSGIFYQNNVFRAKNKGLRKRCEDLEVTLIAKFTKDTEIGELQRTVDKL